MRETQTQEKKEGMGAETNGQNRGAKKGKDIISILSINVLPSSHGRHVSGLSHLLRAPFDRLTQISLQHRATKKGPNLHHHTALIEDALFFQTGNVSRPLISITVRKEKKMTLI